MSTDTRPDVSSFVVAAIKQLGSEAKLGAAAGFSQHAIWLAKKRGRVSAEMAFGIDRATGGQVSKSALRPDLFPADQEAAA